MFKKNEKGFTLIEIIVVVVILAVLMAVAVPSILKYVNTAQEAPALTETRAIVSAAQKRVVDKYAQDRSDDMTLNADDNLWIEEFVDEGGSIQGTVTLTDKEVSRLLYKASNGLYVLYENQTMTIVSEDDITNTIEKQLTSSVSNYQMMIQQLYESNMISKYTGREEVIKQLVAKNGSFEKVSDELKEQINAETDLYWKPYYLGTTDNPSVALFANGSDKSHGGWVTSLVFVNGTVYSCSPHTSINKYYDYKTADALQQYIESQTDVYTKIS